MSTAVNSQQESRYRYTDGNGIWTTMVKKIG